MNYFIVLIVLLQVGAAIYEWHHLHWYGGLLWVGCVISNTAILGWMTR
jgi:hypothetical protein